MGAVAHTGHVDRQRGLGDNFGLLPISMVGTLERVGICVCRLVRKLEELQLAWYAKASLGLSPLAGPG